MACNPGPASGWNDLKSWLAIPGPLQAQRNWFCGLQFRARHKRGGDRKKVGLDAALDVANASDDQLLAVDGALDELNTLDPQKAKIVELRFYGGLTIEEAAAVLNVSESTIAREWRLARAFLRASLEDEESMAKS